MGIVDNEKQSVMKTIRNIIFDFDGTLVDTAPLIIATMQSAISKLGLPARTDNECRATIGRRLEEIPSVLWPGLQNISAEFAKTYRRTFDELKRPLPVRCFPGVIDTLNTMHAEGYGLAIASSRSHRSLDEYADMFGISGLFGMLVGGDDVAEGKPSAEPVTTILDALGWKASETLVVGDADVDIMMGRNAGTATCGVTYGNGTRRQLLAAGPTALIDSFPALITQELFFRTIPDAGNQESLT